MLQGSDKTADTRRKHASLILLKQRYLVGDLITRGGMAEVYRGQDLQENRTVALKLLQETISTSSASVECLRHEALLLASLRHPSIVQIFDEGQHDDLCFLVLEFIEGTSLLHELRRQHSLTVERALIIAHAVALALGAAHRSGVIHQDVKPSNIMLGQHGEIKLIDFGIARTCQEEQERAASFEGPFWGTPQYLAPEQAQGHRISPATDIYALGVVLYEMLLGHPPFLGETPVAIVAQHIWNVPPSPRQQNPLLPPVLEEVLLRCLEKEPTWRFQDGNALAHILAQLVKCASGDKWRTYYQEEGEMMPAARHPSIQGYPVGASGGMSRSHDPLREVHSQRKKPRADGQESARFSLVVFFAIIAGMALLMGLSLYLTLHHL
jgi:serine/threonine-protein kinase